MDKYKKGLLLTLILGIISFTFSVFLFSLPKDEDAAVLGTQETNLVSSEHNWKKFQYEDKEIKYNSDLLEIKKSNDKALIFPTNLKIFQYGEISSLELEEGIDKILEEKNTYTDLELIHSEDMGTHQIYLFSFTQPYLFKKNDFRNVYLTIYLTQDEYNNRYLVEVRGFNYLKNSKINNAFVEIVSSFNGSLNETSNDNVLGTTTSQVNRGKILGQAGTVKIFSRNCYDVSFSNDFNATFAGKSYEICGAGTGSGFLINTTGEILTNAHVAKPNKFDTVVDGVSTDGQYEIDLGNDLIDMLYVLLGDYVMFLSEDQLQSFYVYLLSEMYSEDFVKITGGVNELYVQQNNNFDIDVEKQDLNKKELYTSATLVRSNDISSIYETILASVEEDELLEDSFENVINSSAFQEGLTGTADLSLIRLDSTKQIPSLIFSEDDPVQGEDVYVVGYPGINESDMLTSNEGQVSSTVTQGSITGIKPNTTNSYDLLQIDASIEAGNSGGPIVNDLGNILGMTTYSLASTSGNFNWGISSTALKSFVSQSGTFNKANEVNILLSSALTDISKDYYSRSKEKLNEVVSGESTLGSVINPLITLCDTNITQGNDKTPWFDLGFIDIPNWGFILIGAILLVIVIVIILLLVLSKKDGSDDFPKTGYENLPNTTPQSPTPVASSPPQATLQHNVQNTQVQPNLVQQEGTNTQPVNIQQPTNY